MENVSRYPGVREDFEQVGASLVKVLWLVTGYPSVQRPNAGVFHQTMVEALISQGLDITVMVPTPLVTRRGITVVGASHRHGQDEESNRILRPRYVALPRQNTLGIGHRLIQVALSKVDFRDYDVVHAHFGYPMGLVAAWLKRKWGIPAILTLHGSDVNVHPEVSRLHLRQFRVAIEKMDKVLAVSKALADRTNVLTGLEPDVLRTGIDLRRFERTLTKGAARRKLGLPDDSFLVLYVGNFIPAKGIVELLHALSRYKDRDVRGVFVGSGPLEPMIRAVDNAIVLGAVDNSQVSTIMSAADVLTLPSHREGLGTVLVEAGAIGLPIVATNVGGIPELISEETGLLIEPRSEEELYNALENVRRNYADALQRTEKLHSLVHEQYNVDENARKLIEIYRGFVHESVAES